MEKSEAARALCGGRYVREAQAGAAAPHCGCRRSHTCTIELRVPIKPSRNASLQAFPRPEATGPSAACTSSLSSPANGEGSRGQAVRSADGVTGNTKEGRGCDSNLIGGAYAPRFSLHRNRYRGRGGRGVGAGAAHRPDEPGRHHDRGRRAGRCRSCADSAGPDHQGVLALASRSSSSIAPRTTSSWRRTPTGSRFAIRSPTRPASRRATTSGWC